MANTNKYLAIKSDRNRQIGDLIVYSDHIEVVDTESKVLGILMHSAETGLLYVKEEEE